MDTDTLLLALAYVADATIVVLGAWEATDPASAIGRWLRRRRGQVVRLGRAEERDVARSLHVLQVDDVTHAQRVTSPELEAPTMRARGTHRPPPLPETVEAIRHDVAGLRGMFAEAGAEVEARLREFEARTKERLAKSEERWAEDLRESQRPSWRQRAIPWLAAVAVVLHIAADLTA